MCGVFGYIGEKNAVDVCLSGLEQLEYRGYDSTGIAGVHQGTISFCKKAGKLSELKKVIQMQPLSLAIAHTRWATHGKVSDQNAHPQFDEKGSVALIHNGIIENYNVLKEELRTQGVRFASETDSEVIAQLIAKYYQGDFLEAFHKTLSRLKGIFALLAIHKNHPDEIVASALHCPLAIAINEQGTETILSSDPCTLIGDNYNVIFLQSGESAKIQKGKVSLYGKSLEQIDKKSTRIEGSSQKPSKGSFEHFMIKEIFEQPLTIQKASLNIEHRMAPTFELFRDASRVLFLGCGTSAHAGQIGTLFLEDFVGIPAISEIASEARYRVSLMEPTTLCIAMSQSGETADTLSALRAVQSHGCKTIAICNSLNSTLAREADTMIFLQAGPEISVCSTKAFTSQIATLALLGIRLGKERKTLSLKEEEQLLQALERIPSEVQCVLDQASWIEKMAQKYADFNNFFFMGRRYMFPTALESALKLKEISYVNANGYPAGELKHGPLALLDAQFPVIAFCANLATEEKIVSNLMEVKARGAPILAIAPHHLTSVKEIADDVIWVPDTLDPLAPFASTVVGQLFAYFFAKTRGCAIDQPRNLAKSVTVE